MKRTPLRRKTGFKKKGFWNPNTVKAKPEALDGFQFDSQSEAREYRLMKTMQAGGHIHGLMVHPKVVLIPADKVRCTPEIAYHPDLGFYEEGRLVFTDNKSRGIRGDGAYTERERLIFKLWAIFAPWPLRITEWRNDRYCVTKIVMGQAEASVAPKIEPCLCEDHPPVARSGQESTPTRVGATGSSL